MERDIYYYLEVARKKIDVEMQMRPDYLIFKMSGKTAPVYETYKPEKWPTHLVPSLP